MNVENVLEEDYETQHFGFHPRVFFDEVYNTFYENLHEALNQMKTYLTDNYKTVTTPSSIATGTENLFKIMLKELDKAIDKLELYVDANIFTVPKHVTLPEDEVHISHPCTKEEDAELDEEIEQLKKNIQKERIRQYFLKLKLTEQKAVINELVAFKKQLESMFTSLIQTKVKKESIQDTFEKFFQLLQQIKEPLSSSVDS